MKNKRHSLSHFNLQDINLDKFENVMIPDLRKKNDKSMINYTVHSDEINSLNESVFEDDINNPLKDVYY